MMHELKADPAMFARLADGSKTFELRRDDRGFQAGDSLVIRSFGAKDHDCDDAKCSYNWRGFNRTRLVFRIGFVAKGTFYGLSLGEFAILSLVPVEEDPS